MVVHMSPSGLRERKKDQTRQAIREAAVRLFADRGFERVTVTEIASEANVSVATVFNYFPTKDEIVFSGMEVFETELLHAIRDREPGTSVLAAFKAFILGLHGMLVSTNPNGATRLAQISRIVLGSPALQDREGQIFSRSARALARLIAQETDAAADDMNPYVVANTLIGVHRAMLDQVRRRAASRTPPSTISRDVHSYAEQALTLLADGLGDYAIKSP
jgi:AcrR family transcriptional regulator